jgi:hypothetical protein
MLFSSLYTKLYPVLLLVEGKTKPFEELPSYKKDPTTPRQAESDNETETDDSPWEISSSSEDDDQSDPGGSSKHAKGCDGFENAHLTTTGPLLLVQKPTMEIPQLLESIKFTVTCLYKIPIRRPAPLDRLKLKSSIDASFYQPFDVLYVKDKFPKLDPKVATRLGKMISRRRELLFYRVSHNTALKRAKMEPKPMTVTQLPTISLLPTQNDSMTETFHQTVVSGSQAENSRYTLQTKATTFCINASPVEVPGTLYARSITESTMSRASSYADRKLRVDLPPRPKGVNGNELDLFECPYCLITQSIRSDRAWK